jgi:deoxyribonuclease V
VEIVSSHSWDLSPEEAASLQSDLATRLVLASSVYLDTVSSLAAADAAYDKTDRRVYAAVVVFDFPSLVSKETVMGSALTSHDYSPGLLAFREGPLLLDLFSRLKSSPDVLLFDAQGIAHPRGFGLASHLGYLLDKPSIGCAKSVLVGEFEMPATSQGAFSPLVHENKVIGAAVRTRVEAKPVFVSVGNKIDLETAINLVLASCRGYRLPEPLRQAHMSANRLRHSAA